jgi:Ca2+-binding EF-hand superfamily protein
VITRSEITDPRMQMMFDRMAERMGITNGQITREQFTQNMRQRMQERGGGSAPPNTPNPAANSTTPSPAEASSDSGDSADRTANRAESMFRRLDQNGDGVLNNDEMPESLRAERDKWDADHNGLIDLNEFKAYFRARMQQFQSDRGPTGGDAFPAEGNMLDPNAVPAPAIEEERKPVVYRAGKLPKELPAWFAQIDTDHDGQIGLYEWRAAGRPIAEFEKMDRNGDGFLTIEEVLRSVALTKNGASTPAANGVTASDSNPNGQSAGDGTRIARYPGGDQSRSSRRGRQSRSSSPN